MAVKTTWMYLRQVMPLGIFTSAIVIVKTNEFH